MYETTTVYSAPFGFRNSFLRSLQSSESYLHEERALQDTEERRASENPFTSRNRLSLYKRSSKIVVETLNGDIMMSGSSCVLLHIKDSTRPGDLDAIDYLIHLD